MTSSAKKAIPKHLRRAISHSSWFHKCSFMPVQTPAVAKCPNPTDASSQSVKKVKLSQEKGSVKGRPGPVAAIFVKTKPVPNVSTSAPELLQTQPETMEPQPGDVQDTEILPSRWSDDDEGSKPDDVEPEDSVKVNPNSLVQLSFPKKKKG